MSQFIVNVDSIIQGARVIGNIGNSIRSIEHQIRNAVDILMYDVFSSAVYEADSYGGFPQEFQSHVLNTINTFRGTSVIFSGSSVYINLNLEELGTQEDLRRAFHQGALLAGGGRLWGPYTGQALNNDDAEQRHVFWEAFREGAKTVEVQRNGKTYHVPTNKSGHDWEDTKQQYINIWGNKCPEWLFIQYGQEEWEPYIPQIDIIGNLQAELGSVVTQIIEAFVEYEVALANQYEAEYGAEIGFNKRGSPVLESGSIRIGERPYRKGQFIPKTI